MNRESLFRGFHEDPNGKETIIIDGKAVKGMWVYGAFGQHTSLDAMIIDRPYLTQNGKLSALGFWTVIPSTVGQFTGSLDKHGKKIFEGDIVKLKDYHGERPVYIFWGCGVWCYGGDGYSDEYIFNSSQRKVIGNIFENPELLEEEKHE